MFFALHSYANVYPLQFSVSETKIVKEIPRKDKDFAHVVPGELSTYIFTEEADYYGDYQRSYYAVTRKKGGWDCMRHYEILANGCIPYFVDLAGANSKTMYFLPKDLILQAMNLRGVYFDKRTKKGWINHRIFDRAKYYELLGKILEHTRKHLTTKSMADYVLRTMNYSGSGKILYLSEDVGPDYLRCATLAGFKELLQDRVVDYPKITHIYKSYPNDIKALYGKGFTYAKVVDDFPVDRENIEVRIQQKEFDLVIYGSVHRGLPFHQLVQAVYHPDQILYFCGEDDHKCEYANLPHLFLREFESLPGR